MEEKSARVKVLVASFTLPRLFGRDAASQIAASVALFLPPLPSVRYGPTKFAAINLASNPIDRSLCAQWYALDASIATRYLCGSCAHQGTNSVSVR